MRGHWAHGASAANAARCITSMATAEGVTGIMPQYKKGNMWDAPAADLTCITTNSVIQGSALVMGKGVAGEAAKRYPNLPVFFAHQIFHCSPAKVERIDDKELLMSDYGLVTVSLLLVTLAGRSIGLDELVRSRDTDGRELGAFQTKRDWRTDSTLELIAFSVDILMYWIAINEGKSVYLPFPGIGAGKLKRQDVLPIIERLPSNVTIWEK